MGKQFGGIIAITFVAFFALQFLICAAQNEDFSQCVRERSGDSCKSAMKRLGERGLLDDPDIQECAELSDGDAFENNNCDEFLKTAGASDDDIKCLKRLAEARTECMEME